MDSPAVVQKSGGKVVWIKDKGPEHIVDEYWIFCWLGPNAFTNHKELFDRIQACSYQLGSIAIICRRYASRRKSIQTFFEIRMTGRDLISREELNAHHQLLEEIVVDIESFFWFANRLLTQVALTLKYFFTKLKKNPSNSQGIKSHSTLIQSKIFPLLPSRLQTMAHTLKAEVSDFRNSEIEHAMKYWRAKGTSFASLKPGEEWQVRITYPPAPEAYPEKPLRELWILLHDYVTDVAKFLGAQI